MATSENTTKLYSQGDAFDLLANFQGGWYGEKPNCSVSGIGNDFERARKYAREGTIIVDGTNLEYGVVCDLSIRGPVRDLNLPANTYQSLFGQPQSAEGKAYSDFRSLDAVSLDLWLAEARRLGAKVGTYSNGQVVWEVN